MSIDHEEFFPPTHVPIRRDQKLEEIDGISVIQAHEGLKVNLQDDYSWALQYCARCFSFDDPGKMRLKVIFDNGRIGMVKNNITNEEIFFKKNGIWVNQGKKYLDNDKLFFKENYDIDTEVYQAFEALEKASLKLPEFINRVH